MALVMSLSKKGGAFTVDVYLMNPGEVLKNFGLSGHDLVIQKTASLIVRKTYFESGEVADTEYDIHNPKPWKWFDELLNWHGFKMTAEQPSDDVSIKPQEAA